MINDLLNRFRMQALSELPQTDFDSAEDVFKEYINSMTTYELLEFISRTLQEEQP